MVVEHGNRGERPHAHDSTVKAFVTHRFAMSLETFRLLTHNLKEISSKMRKSGLLEKDDAQEEAK